jgi:mannose-6-phosphate isomerase-like protein (cupin superfamily)
MLRVCLCLQSQGQGPQSTATPPYHYHYYQEEEFSVQSGTLCYKIDGKLGKLEAGQSVTIPTYCRHTFWNDPSTGTDLDVNISVSGGGNDGFSDDFVHNFYGYLSCTFLCCSRCLRIMRLRRHRR